MAIAGRPYGRPVVAALARAVLIAVATAGLPTRSIPRGHPGWEPAPVA